MKIPKKFAEKLASQYGTTYDIVQDVADDCETIPEISSSLREIFNKEPGSDYAKEHESTLVRSTDLRGDDGNG